MKSLNVKKIAAVAAGAGLIAAGLAGAQVTVDPSVGQYKWFSNGEPNVKIVVGSKAQIWDGVAAANIAAMLGNLAYSDQDVVPGSGGSTGNSTGTLSGKGVAVSLTTPAGATGQTGTAIVSTQMWDFLDADVLTLQTGRQNNATALIGDGITTGGYKFSANTFPDVVFKGKVDNMGTYNIQQEDAYYVSGQSYYDTSSKQYVADQIQIAYTTNFTDPLPYHIDIVNGSTTGTGRATNDDKITENRNVHVKFLGSDYVVTDFENGTATTNPTITLGQAAVFKQMKAGDTVKVGERTVRLTSISPIATSSAQLPFAYFDLLDSSGARVDYFSMSKGSADYNKNGVILHVRDVFVGGGDSSYAEVQVYSASIVLQDGNKLQFQGDDATTKLNQDASWTANLDFGTLNIAGELQKTLRQIKVTGARSTRVTIGSGFDLIAKPVFKRLTFLGPDAVDTDTLTITALGRQTYSRVTNQTGDNSPSGANVDVNVTTLKSGYASAFASGGKNYDTLYLDEYNGRILVYDSTASQANYTVNSDVADNAVDYQYPATTLTNAVRLYTTGSRPGPTVSAAVTGGCVFNLTQPDNAPVNFMVTFNDTTTGVSRAGVVNGVALTGAATACGAVVSWVAVPGASYYQIYISNGTGGGATLLGQAAAGTTSFNTSASGANLSAVPLTGTSLPNNTARAARLRIFEPMLDNAPSTLNGNYDIDLFPSDANYIYNSSTTGTLTTLFASSVAGTGLAAALPASGGTSYEKGFVSPGGSVLSDLTLTGAVIKYPKKLVHAKYQFGAPSNVNVTAGGATVTERTMAEGEEYALGGGYKVKVSSITATVKCTGGAAGVAACTPNKAAVVTPLSATDHLVVLDSDAGSTGQLVVVGGPLVNSVAADTPGVADVTNTPGSSVIKVIGSKVVVAGYTAQDTTDAANALVKWLSDNRDAVRGV